VAMGGMLGVRNALLVRAVSRAHALAAIPCAVDAILIRAPQRPRRRSPPSRPSEAPPPTRPGRSDRGAWTARHRPRCLWHYGAVARGDGRLSHDLLPGEKGPQDACGVFGVFAPGEDVSKLTYYGLYALQHRGQESAGIATSDGSQIMVYKAMGLVSQVVDEASVEALQGHIAMGHTRYSTTG